MWNIQIIARYSFILSVLIDTTTFAYINTINQKKILFSSRTAPSKPNTVLSVVKESSSNTENSIKSINSIQKSVAVLALSTSLLSISSTHNIANAYETSADYAGDAVTSAVRMLQDASGNREETFAAYENIRDIITEGKGVGGSLSYSGLDLQRGVVADEDTTIYNPGLTLLTESEKNTLVQAVVQSRKAALPTAETSWSEKNEGAYKFLKYNLDPFHLVEISGYLSILPFWAAFVYLGNIFVQQNARSVFQASYLLSVALVFGPILALVAFGS